MGIKQIEALYQRLFQLQIKAQWPAHGNLDNAFVSCFRQHTRDGRPGYANGARDFLLREIVYVIHLGHVREQRVTLVATGILGHCACLLRYCNRTARLATVSWSQRVRNRGPCPLHPRPHSTQTSFSLRAFLILTSQSFWCTIVTIVIIKVHIC